MFLWFAYLWQDNGSVPNGDHGFWLLGFFCIPEAVLWLGKCRADEQVHRDSGGSWEEEMYTVMSNVASWVTEGLIGYNSLAGQFLY